ncbi:MAG: DUF2059 domain-containing protein [Gammaproteobacteria bacterium]
MRNPILTLTIALLLCLNSAGLLADDSAHRQQVEKLFKLTQMEKRIQESVESVLQLQLRQNPQIADKKATVARFFDKYIGWNALKEDIAQMYMKTFSEKELEDINAFYITPAGQKVINIVPQLVQQRNQLAMERLQENIGELQNILAGSAAPSQP